MKKKTKSALLKLPAEIILIIACIASFLLKMFKVVQLTWATPITLMVIIILYFWGRFLEKPNPFEI